MSKPAWTPGAWRAASKPSAVVGWPVVSIHGRSICSVAYRNDWNLPESAERGEAKANAALIAASPSLAQYVQRKADEGDEEARRLMETVHASG
jgi:hypothetical protein